MGSRSRKNCEPKQTEANACRDPCPWYPPRLGRNPPDVSSRGTVSVCGIKSPFITSSCSLPSSIEHSRIPFLIYPCVKIPIPLPGIHRSRCASFDQPCVYAAHLGMYPSGSNRPCCKKERRRDRVLLRSEMQIKNRKEKREGV